MIEAPISLQDLRRRIYAKAKAEPAWRFWGLFAHVCKLEVLREAYTLARKNDGAPGIDGVTFEAIEVGGVENFLQQIRSELLSHTYRPMRNRRKEIPKDGGKKVRVLGIPSIRDRVVQGALRLILEPIFEADFQPGSYGYRGGVADGFTRRSDLGTIDAPPALYGDLPGLLWECEAIHPLGSGVSVMFDPGPRHLYQGWCRKFLEPGRSHGEPWSGAFNLCSCSKTSRSVAAARPSSSSELNFGRAEMYELNPFTATVHSRRMSRAL